MISQDEIDRMESDMKKIWDKVEIDRPFDLESLERTKMPDCMVKWADDFLEANGVSQ